MGWIWITIFTFVGVNILLFLIYWFELDDLLIKSFEPTFKKLSDHYRAKRGLL
ncbi:hypothetical protein ACFL27_06280 [candidate division CSSED10-310 bacterium]|uniref:Uncharacterized protein n=1 Tax=candidate division CSSED10-310 bacterium TaxID=2855610 RepID=A0ABV6YUD8_UNCC1